MKQKSHDEKFLFTLFYIYYDLKKKNMRGHVWTCLVTKQVFIYFVKKKKKKKIAWILRALLPRILFFKTSNILK